VGALIKTGFPLLSLVPWIPDISFVDMIKLPCCNALSTRNRAFELTPTSSRGYYLVSASRPTSLPEAENLMLRFVMTAEAPRKKHEGGHWPQPWSLLRLTLLLRSSDYCDIPILSLLSLGSCPCPGSQDCFRWRVNKPKNQNRCRTVQPEWDMTG
jgi:hypothetical protein